MNFMRIYREGGDRATTIRILAAGTVLAVASAAMGQSFTLLGNPVGRTKTNPSGISDDGRVVTGRSTGSIPFQYFVAVDGLRRDLSIPTGLTSFYSTNVSGDGQYLVVGGQATGSGVSKPGLYRISDGSYSLFEANFGSGWGSTAVASSRDGGIVAGWSSNADNTTYQSWYRIGSGNAVAIPSGNRGGFAMDISSDGRFICGNERPSGVAGSPFIYDREMNTYTSLDQRIGDAYAISGDGRVVVGCAIGNDGWLRPAKWQNGEMQFLTNDYPGQGDFTAYDSSFDGAVITIRSLIGFNGPFSFIWTESRGLVEARAFFESYGVVIPAELEISAPIHVSADGLTFTGSVFRDGGSQPFVITIPASGTAMFTLSALVFVGVRRRR
jgi:uncharacterized membrane protein